MCQMFLAHSAFFVFIVFAVFVVFIVFIDDSVIWTMLTAPSDRDTVQDIRAIEYLMRDRNQEWKGIRLNREALGCQE